MADYPREINLDADTKERLKSYLDTELVNNQAERATFLENLIRWQREYWAEPITKQATFPFVGAATIVIPLAAIAIEAIHSRNMTTLFSLNQFISVHARHDNYEDWVDPLERFLDYEFVRRMNIEASLDSPALEFVKFGTAVGKSGYEKVVKTAVRPAADGSDREEEFQVITKQGAVIDGVPLNRFIMPNSSLDPQESAWVGEEHSETPYTVFGYIDSKLFGQPNIRENLEAWLVTPAVTSPGAITDTRRFEQSQEKLEGTEAVWPKRLDWQEVWLAFNVDADPLSKTKEIVVHYHRESGTFMSIRYNWHNALHRPYRIGQYFPVEHRWAGIGVCKQSEQFQKEVTTQHRQRLDNATLANVRMLKVNKMSGYGPKEPIFPGKMWFLDNMEDIESVQMGEIYPSSYNNETASLQYYQQRTGVNEDSLGQPQAGTPGTATSDLARIQEGNKKHDYTYHRFRTFTNQLVLDAVCNIHQFGGRNNSYIAKSNDAAILQQFFELPIEDLREATCLDIVVAGKNQNKLIDRQNYQQVIQGVTTYYQQLMELAQATQNQQLIMLIGQKAPLAATEVMKQFLETFDMKKIDRLLLSELLKNGTQPTLIGSGDTGTPPVVSPQGMGGAPTFGA